jgi:hypothetical protein
VNRMTGAAVRESGTVQFVEKFTVADEIGPAWQKKGSGAKEKYSADCLLMLVRQVFGHARKQPKMFRAGLRRWRPGTAPTI